MIAKMYDFPCEHCQGTVRERRMQREAIRHNGNFVILEDVPIGVCEKCGARYFHAFVLRKAAEVGRGTIAPIRTIVVPVGSFVPTT